MTETAIKGTDPKYLDELVTELYRTGEKLRLVLGMPRELSDDEVDTVTERLRHSGLAVTSARFGSTTDWPYALEMDFARPRSLAPGERGLLPLAVLLVLALGAVGVGSFLGFQIGKIPEAISKNIVPLALIGGGIFVIYNFSKQGSGAR